MFKKYSSIENHYREVYVDSLKMQGFTRPNIIWVAREKIHGTNMSVLVTKDSITWCKRSGPIEEGEKFYNHTIVTKEIEAKIVEMCQGFFEHGISTVQVYGELAGEGVMSQVNYGAKDFYIFDLVADGRELADIKLQDLTREFGLKMAPLLGIGTFDRLFAMSREFESNVNRFNVAFSSNPGNAGRTIWNTNEPVGNTAEGIVLKPDVSLYDRFGSRVILKLKSDKFKEKEKAARIKVTVPFSDEDQEALDIMCSYVTQARFDNVMSKEDYTIKQVGMVIGLLAKDALEDIEKDNEFTLDEAKRVSKEFNRIVSELVRANINKFK